MFDGECIDYLWFVVEVCSWMIVVVGMVIIVVDYLKFGCVMLVWINGVVVVCYLVIECVFDKVVCCVLMVCGIELFVCD